MIQVTTSPVLRGQAVLTPHTVPTTGETAAIAGQPPVRLRRIGESELTVFPLAISGNVFGWTADEPTSFALLDAYAAAGGNFIDTADSYSAWVEGHTGGESEEILGRWMQARGNRDRMVIATKVGGHPERKNLSPENLRGACDASLRRLRTDRIDLWYTHYDEPGRPVEEFLGVLDELVRAGKVRWIGASNVTAERLDEAVRASERAGLARYVALQPHYNLVARERYEGALAEVVARHGLAAIPYYAVAAGFLTGKYRPGGPEVASARARGASKYLADPRALRVLGVLDEVAAAHGVEVATVAIAWLRDRPTVAAPIASARTVEQLPALLAAADLVLTAEEIAALDAASA